MWDHFRFLYDQDEKIWISVFIGLEKTNTEVKFPKDMYVTHIKTGKRFYYEKRSVFTSLFTTGQKKEIGFNGFTLSYVLESDRQDIANFFTSGLPQSLRYLSDPE